MTEDETALTAVLRGVERAQAAPLRGRARLLGTHLEGPFISEKKLGAQPPKARHGDRAALERLLAAGPVAVVTLAPELPGALDLVSLLRERGLRASLGHSDASYEQAKAAFENGARGVTHLLNAMSGLHHRTPGLAAAALDAADATLELILDLHHVHPAVFQLMLRAAKGKLALVTDAIRAAGLPDGETELGGQRVTVAKGRATLSDGTLAGSVLTLDRAFANAVHAGCPIEEAVALVSTNPALALGRTDLGRIAKDAQADLVELDPDSFAVKRVFVGGVEL